MSASLHNEENTLPLPVGKEGYTIRIEGNLSPELVEWLDNDVVVQNLPNGEALLFCPSTDQAALHGALGRLYSLGLKILELSISHDRK
jgi:hypothetical protein